MKKIILLTVAMVFVASMAFGWTVVGSKHDMRGFITNEGSPSQVCVYCHTPHQASTANKQDPLWNHSFPSAGTYGAYSSSTMNATANEIKVVVGNASVSMLCMTCHDGSVAIFALYKAPTAGAGTTGSGTDVSNAGLITSSANLGTDLTDDHPINFTYDAALATSDGGLETALTTSSVTGDGIRLPLFGSTVQCASCHSVHDNSNLPFLRTANTNSALCLVCHLK